MWKNYRLKGGYNEYAELLLVGITEKDWVDFWTGHLRTLQDEGEPAALHSARAL